MDWPAIYICTLECIFVYKLCYRNNVGYMYSVWISMWCPDNMHQFMITVLTLSLTTMPSTVLAWVILRKSNTVSNNERNTPDSMPQTNCNDSHNCPQIVDVQTHSHKYSSYFIQRHYQVWYQAKRTVMSGKTHAFILNSVVVCLSLATCLYVTVCIMLNEHCSVKKHFFTMGVSAVSSWENYSEWWVDVE